MFRSQDRVKCRQLFDKYYGGRVFHDGLYRETIKTHLQPGNRLLDAGCGRYLKYSKELSGIAYVVGMDLEPALDSRNDQNPFAVRGDLSHLPLKTNSFDMVISRHVVEHLEDPVQVFREFSRVLRPGGKLVILTPNKYDYVSVIAALTPHCFHTALVSRIFQVPESDIFPTLYRANTVSSLSKALRSAGLVDKEVRTLTHYPAYLMFSPVLFRLGVLYERLTSREFFRSLRGSLLCVCEKRRTSETAAATALNCTSVEVS